jgi:two-component sensor histidine kinase
MLCSEKVGMQEADIVCLENMEKNLQIIAELTGSDVFIDCLMPDNTALVVAEAKPVSVKSAYTETVVGMIALPDDEPAVFNAFTSGMPVRDLKAITQEKCLVKQDVVPINGINGDVIAVLIRETDISQYIRQNEKYEKLARERDNLNASLFSGSNEQNLDNHQVSLLETHHRVKNNLQLIASILSMQSRRSTQPEVKKILGENVNRVLSISAIHDILCASSDNCHVKVNSRLLFQKLVENFRSLTPENCMINFNIEGDDIEFSADKASSISVVVNELLTNSVLHAFNGRTQGKVTLTTKEGNLYSTISVEDDGVGYDFGERNKSSLGLDIVSVTVKDKLKGNLRGSSDSTGTKVIFDFIN